MVLPILPCTHPRYRIHGYPLVGVVVLLLFLLLCVVCVIVVRLDVEAYNTCEHAMCVEVWNSRQHARKVGKI